MITEYAIQELRKPGEKYAGYWVKIRDYIKPEEVRAELIETVEGWLYIKGEGGDEVIELKANDGREYRAVCAACLGTGKLSADGVVDPAEPYRTAPIEEVDCECKK